MVLPGMSDGRQFTIYTPACKLNQEIMKSLGTTNDNEYRKLLQSPEIIKKLNNLENKMKIYQ